MNTNTHPNRSNRIKSDGMINIHFYWLRTSCTNSTGKCCEMSNLDENVNIAYSYYENGIVICFKV